MHAHSRRTMKWASGLLFLFIAWPLMVFAQDELLVNVDAANPPFMYGTMDQAQGLYPELIAAVFRQMGRPVKLVAKPWKRAIGELDMAAAGVGGIYKTEERLKKYDYSEPLFTERIAVYSLRNKPIAYGKLSDLYGKRIGVLLGWSYGDDFDNARKAGKVTVEEVYSDSQNFDKLAHGRLDVVLAIEQVGTSLMRIGSNAAIEKGPVYLAEQSTHLALHKNMQASALLADFNRALQEIRKNGAYNKIVDKLGTVTK